MKIKKKPLDKQILLTYVISLVVVYAFQLTVMVIFPRIFEDEALMITFSSLSNLAWYAAVTAIVVHLAYIYLFKNQWTYFKENPRRSWGLIALAIGLMFAANMLTSSIFQLAGHDTTAENQAALEMLLGGAWHDILALVLFAGFFAPVLEELVFRRGLYSLFFKKYGNLAAILLNSLVFALLHFLNDLEFVVQDPIRVLNLFPYLSLGIILSFIYYYSGKMIFVVIFAHMIWNILQLTLMFTVL